MYDNSTTGVQQKNAELCQSRGGYSGQEKEPQKITAVVRRAMPERGRHGGFCLSTPLDAPRSPSTSTTVHIYSGRYHTAEHALVQDLFLCRAGMDVLQHVRWYRYSAGISIFSRFSAIPGSERPVPGRPTYNAHRSPSWARHPLFAGDKEGLLCEWDVAPQRGRGTPGGARDSQLFFGCVVTKIFSKIQMTTTWYDVTSELFFIPGIL